jgi:hypothetical protein
MNNETYHARPELSNSMMNKLLKSPAHLKYYLDNGQEPTPAMILGTQVHTALLEPGEWTQYARGVEGDRRTKAVKAEHQKLLEQYSPDQIIKHETYDQIEDMVESVLLESKCCHATQVGTSLMATLKSRYFTPIRSRRYRARLGLMQCQDAKLYVQ